MKKKYGKTIEGIFDIKQNFFQNDEQLLIDNLKVSEVACQQPKRINCKNCDRKLQEGVDFIKQKISYILCENCNHLNSKYDDTEELANAIYVEEITNYSKTYAESNKESWINRAQRIYVPKAEFLKSILGDKKSISNYSVADLGAGSGYFIYALEEVGFSNVQGYEVSRNQVNLSELMLKNKNVQYTELNDLLNIVQTVSADVISMVGVLEHLTNPRKVLQAISKNPSIKYLYISVPLFSYSVFMELLNENHFNRHLSGGHTHLYTNESLEYMAKEFNFTIEAKWQFGADIMDAFRFSSIKLKSKMSSKMQEIYEEKMLGIMDDLQLVMDKNNFSSEVHMIFKVNKEG